MELQAEEEVPGHAKPAGTYGDLVLLVRLGTRLDCPMRRTNGETVAMWLARVLLKVRGRSGETVPLTANAAQRAYERRRGQRNIVLKARQMGMSTWIAGRFFLKTITRPGTLTVQVAHNREAAEQIFRMVHRFYEQLPEGLHEGALRASRVNAGQIQFPELDSEYRVESAADMNAGRGMTIQNLHCSEVARWERNGAETMASLRAALAPGGELVLESTPNGAHGCFYDEWRRADETGTVRHFFPWWMEPAYAGTVSAEEPWTDEERELAEAHGLTGSQIAYRRQLRASFLQLAAQEYAEDPETCFLASGNCVFDLESIAQRMRAVAEPRTQRRNGEVWIWYPPLKGRRYVMGVDAAGGGTAGDYAAAQVIDLETGLQCAELRGHLDPWTLAKETAALGREYNGAMMAVERNNHGHGVLAFLRTAELYPWIHEQNGAPGLLTTQITRPQMIAQMSALLLTRPEGISSSRLLAECRTFVRREDGRMEAAAGTHDDCVMAMGMALLVRAEMLAG